MNTYISLFSSAGIGCYGFKQAGFECIATNEYIERRILVQKHNNKCKYESGYICGDITSDEIKVKLYAEIDMWHKVEKIKDVDVIIATPPCQGMSVANHKKSSDEIVRNSLVVESIKIIDKIKPRFFIFENVPTFMKTLCTDIDGQDKLISDVVDRILGENYSYVSNIINFKNYGACSSRTRTLVIGVRKDIADEISPWELYPNIQKEKTLREVIGGLTPLNTFGEISEDDIYHMFREYPTHMRDWIHDLKEGESAFDNKDDRKKPHQIIDGKIVINQRKNADKYTRQYWDKVGPCVHTRNDQLASQNTIHPKDDRVFSIRELMMMMTVPYDFKWSEYSLEELNKLSFEEKKKYLKKEEIKIRQSLGEAVPTIIFNQIAQNILSFLMTERTTEKKMYEIIEQKCLTDVKNMISFIDENPYNFSIGTLSRIAELANSKRTDDAAFYTNKAIITEMAKQMPDIEAETVHILEPSAGVGNFVPIVLKRYADKKIVFDLVDINADSKLIFEKLVSKYNIQNNVEFNYIVDDFLLHKFDNKYDLVVGNPPFFKLKQKDSLLDVYRKNAINGDTTNICSFFLEKALLISKHTGIIFPKFLLNTPEFQKTRDMLCQKHIPCIIDFGEKGFKGVLIETIGIFISPNKKKKETLIVNVTDNFQNKQLQEYITDTQFPYWLIYRNEFFDTICNKLDLGVFNVFRDRQLTNAHFSKSGTVRVLKARNISDDGNIVDIDGYDSYITEENLKNLSVYSYINTENIYLSPNMTYKPRVIRKPKGVIVNGSVAILIPKTDFVLSDGELKYFSSDEYRHFYKIARNYQTRSLNIDSCSVFFFGKIKGGLNNNVKQDIEIFE